MKKWSIKIFKQRKTHFMSFLRERISPEQIIQRNWSYKQGPRSCFLLVGLIEHRRCEMSRGETFEIKSPEMPGNTSNFNNHDEVAYSLCLDSYIFNANICIEQNNWWGFSPASHPAPRSLTKYKFSRLLQKPKKMKLKNRVRG